MRALRVFWPKNVISDGLFIGWINEDVVVVAAVVALESVSKSYQEQIEGYEKWLELRDGCKTAPRILGRVKTVSDGTHTIEFDDGSMKNLPSYFIYYSRPSLYQMRFFSVTPLQLDITAGSREELSGGFSMDRNRTEVLLNTWRSPSVDYDLRCIAQQLNASGVIDSALRSSEGSTKLVSPPTASKGTLRQSVYRAVKSVTQFLSDICNLRISLFDSTNRLKDVSATVQQLDVRLEQFTFFPSQVGLISTRSRRDIANYSAQYINFYNNIWLIFNDIVVGTAIGTILCENHEYFGHLLHKYTEILTVRIINDSLVWLDNWPAGLKLNTELSRALCVSFMVLTTIWARALNNLADYFPVFIYIIGLSGRLGLTMILSMFSDMISLLTIHIYLSYLAATAVCHRIIQTAGSLWNLFRGKRYNVLQKRLDSWDYSLDQLLLGTMLFTLVTFLSPTIVVYYGLFATARLAIIFLHATLETLLAFMNHFPLFVLMMRIKDPLRLPGGIVFVPSKRKGSLEIKNVPIPFTGIFFQHLLLWGRVSAHYHPLRLLRHVVSATVINPIPRYSIRYSMLPTASPDPAKAKKLKLD